MISETFQMFDHANKGFVIPLSSFPSLSLLPLQVLILLFSFTQGAKGRELSKRYTTTQYNILWMACAPVQWKDVWWGIVCSMALSQTKAVCYIYLISQLFLLSCYRVVCFSLLLFLSLILFCMYLRLIRYEDRRVRTIKGVELDKLFLRYMVDSVTSGN